MHILKINPSILPLLACTLVYPAHSYSQDILLQPGHWQYHQNTIIDGKKIPGRDIAGGECVLEEDSKRPVEHYIEKFRAGLGPDSKCTMLNQKHQPKQFTFDLHCQSEGVESKHQVQYHYSPSAVHVLSEGTLNAAGRTIKIQTTNQSVRVRKCTKDEEKLARDYRNIDQLTEYTKPLAKPLFTISSEAAGPIKEPLVLSKDAVQRLFPEFKITKSKVTTDVETQNSRHIYTIHHKNDNIPIFQIDSRQNSTTAFSVFTNSSAVAGPYGERVGITKLKNIFKGKRNLCTLGENRLSQTVVCLDKNFRSLYELPENILRQYNPGDTIPDSVLDQAVLSEMRRYLGYPRKTSQNKNQSTDTDTIIRLNSDNFHSALKKIDTKQPIVVHFTSTDGSCPHCMKNNAVFSDFHRTHSDQYTFVEVVFNPWRNYLKKFKRLGGLPATELYLDKLAVNTIIGHRKDLSDLLINQHKKTENILNDDYSDVLIQESSSASLGKLIKEQSSGNLLLVNVTSTDTNCPTCLKHNSFLRHAARQHKSEKVVFSEILYQPYKSVKNDAELKQYLASQKMKINGLPVTLVYKDGKAVGMRPGIWPTMYEDVDKFLQRK